MDTEAVSTHFNFEVLFYSNPQPMWIFDVYTLRILEVNDAAVKRYGYTKHEFLGKTILDLRPESDIAQVHKVLNEIQGHNTNQREFNHISKDGVLLNVSITSYSIAYQGRRARLVHATNIDEHKSIVTQLKTTSNRLEHMLENTTIGFCQLDNTGLITYWNQAAEQLIGYRREHVAGRHLWEVLPELMQTDLYINCSRAAREGINLESIEYFWPVQKWFSVAVYPAEDGLTIHFRDSTNKKLFEEALISKIAQLKEVSFFNSHYIRKPVASLLGLTYLVNTGLVQENEFKELASHIYESGKELDQVLQTMNDIVNDDQVNYISSELNEFCFGEMLTTLVSQLQQSYPDNPLLVEQTAEVLYYGNKQAIRLAIENLVDNAVKFSPAGSPVHIHTCVVEQSLVITVKDRGVGMSEHTVHSLFESFSRSKIGEVLGSGLGRVTDIAQKHNGCVWVESALNEGSVFSLRLPLSNMASYRATGLPDFSVYKLPEVELQYMPELNCWYAGWLGFHNASSVKIKCMAIANALQLTPVSRLLIDNSQMLGIWEEAVEWVVNVFFPQLQDAGIQQLAVILSPSTFSRLSAINVKKRQRTRIKMEAFEHRNEAEQWLSSYAGLSMQDK